MTSSQEVFAKRKEGDLAAAYAMAVKLMNTNPKDEWNCRAYAWCLIDLIKQEISNNSYQLANEYLEQLNSLSIIETDEVLKKSANSVKQAAQPQWQAVSNAKKFSKSGLHEEAANSFRQALQSYPDDLQLHESLGWELYRLAKPIVSQEAINIFAVKRLLAEYISLKNERPSLLHSCFLQLADKLSGQGEFNVVNFLRIWELENLRPEDYEPFITDEGKKFSGLAEKVIHHAAKDAIAKGDASNIQYLIPYLEHGILRFPANNWLVFYKAKLLAAVGDYSGAARYALEVVKSKVNDFWSWSLLGDIYLNIDEDKALSCYCRSLLCCTDEDFLVNVHLNLAKLLVSRQLYSETKYEIEAVFTICEKNDRKAPEAATLFKSQDWYISVTPCSEAFYKQYSDLAESILFKDLPWINAVLGSSFKDKSSKVRRKLYLSQKGDKLPVEVVVLDRLCNEKHKGQSLSIKGEFDSQGRFTLYQMDRRQSDKSWDIFPVLIAVVDHVNNDKKLVHCVVEKGIDGIIRYSDLPGKVEPGDCLAIRASLATSGRGSGLSIIDSELTNDSASDKALKIFEESVEVVNGYGFTESNIFMDPGLVKKYQVVDGAQVKGTAVINYNKNKGTWGWKVLLLDTL